MTDTRRPVSEAFPRIWVERGGPALAALLAALDDLWAAEAADWPPRPELSGPAVEPLAAATGWAGLLAEVGGVDRVARPDLLPPLLLTTLGGRRPGLGGWLACLFDLTLTAFEIDPARGRRAPALRLTLAGPRPADPNVLLRVVRRLVPAHLNVTAESITWLPEGECHD